jgi:hypothetical protein
MKKLTHYKIKYAKSLRRSVIFLKATSFVLAVIALNFVNFDLFTKLMIMYALITVSKRIK